MANKKNRQKSLPDRDGHTYSVGDGVHHGFNGDAYPGTVLYVSDSGRQVYVSDDTYQVTDKRGAYVEGPRECEFTTVERPIEQCTVYTLRKSGIYHTHGRSKGYAWALQPGREYSYNPCF